MWPLTKEFFGPWSSRSGDFEFVPDPKSSLAFLEDEVESSRPLKSVVENVYSHTQETSPVPESSILGSNRELYADFQTRSGCRVVAAERYGCASDNSQDVFLLNNSRMKNFLIFSRKLGSLNWETNG